MSETPERVPGGIRSEAMARAAPAATGDGCVSRLNAGMRGVALPRKHIPGWHKHNRYRRMAQEKKGRRKTGKSTKAAFLTAQAPGRVPARQARVPAPHPVVRHRGADIPSAALAIRPAGSPEYREKYGLVLDQAFRVMQQAGDPFWEN